MNDHSDRKETLQLDTNNSLFFIAEIKEGYFDRISVEFYVMDKSGDLKLFSFTSEAIQTKLLSGSDDLQYVSTGNIGGDVDGLLQSICYPRGAAKGLMQRVFFRMTKPLDGTDKLFVRSSQNFDVYASKIWSYVKDANGKQWELIKPQAAPSISEFSKVMPW